MSDVLSTEEVIANALDRVLQRANEAGAFARDADRKAREAQDVVNRLDDEARRLRLALFAIEGKDDKNAGDANKANHERRMQLQQEDRA